MPTVDFAWHGTSNEREHLQCRMFLVIWHVIINSPIVARKFEAYTKSCVLTTRQHGAT